MDRDEFERIAALHESKAAKIRALNEAGASTSEIAEFLEIRYQHAYNVLLRAGQVGRSEEERRVEPPEVVVLDVDAGGIVHLPDELREQLDLNEGGQLFCRPTSDGLLLLPRHAAIAEIARHAIERMPEHASLLTALLGKSQVPERKT